MLRNAFLPLCLSWVSVKFVDHTAVWDSGFWFIDAACPWSPVSLCSHSLCFACDCTATRILQWELFSFHWKARFISGQLSSNGTTGTETGVPQVKMLSVMRSTYIFILCPPFLSHIPLPYIPLVPCFFRIGFLKQWPEASGRPLLKACSVTRVWWSVTHIQI